MGSIVITQAAEYRPDKIKKLVYLSAFLLQNSEFLLQYAGQDEASAVTSNLIIAEDHSCATVKAEALREAFYGDCSDEAAEMATSLLVPQSVAPLGAPVSTSPHNFGRIPRAYISCNSKTDLIDANLPQAPKTVIPEKILIGNPVSNWLKSWIPD